MKKYQQLLLFIFSIVSLISLLFYRHEYNKLRYVLEVLNFFGTPGGGQTGSGNCNCDPADDSSTVLLEPLPSWQRIDNNVFIYSAYWDSTDEKRVVKALAVTISSNELQNFKCFVSYPDLRNTIQGSFSVYNLSKTKTKQGEISSCLFYCEIEVMSGVPSTVVFYNNSSEIVFIPLVSLSEHLNTNLTAICVHPVNNVDVRTSSLVEFFSYHKVLGINNFIVYGNAHSHNILKILQDRKFDIHLSILQWNFPFAHNFDLVKNLIEYDCLARTRGIFKNVILLQYEQFIVPRFHSTVTQLISDLDPNNNFNQFQIITYLFCLEYKDDPKSDNTLPTPLRKTRFTYLKNEIPVFIYQPMTLKTILLEKVSKEIVVVNWYTKCASYDLKVPQKNQNYNYDYSVLKFNTDFLRSKILKSFS